MFTANNNKVNYKFGKKIFSINTNNSSNFTQIKAIFLKNVTIFKIGKGVYLIKINFSLSNILKVKIILFSYQM